MRIAGVIVLPSALCITAALVESPFVACALALAGAAIALGFAFVDLPLSRPPLIAFEDRSRDRPVAFVSEGRRVAPPAGSVPGWRMAVPRDASPSVPVRPIAFD